MKTIMELLQADPNISDEFKRALPMSKASLNDPKWKYVHSSHTDISKTFARVRRELAEKRKS